MDFNPEKLLTLEEAARQLGVPADDVEAMIQQKRLPVFRLGGQLLRVRWRDIQGLHSRSGHPQIPKTAFVSSPAGFWERVRDFFYFNDFYLVALLILLTLLAIILTL